MCLTLSSVAIIPLSKRSSGIVKAIVCLDLPGIINYLTERLFFYGDILTTGITGIILYFIIILYLSFIMLKTFRPSNNKYEKYIMLLIPLSLILAYLLTQFEHISIYVLLALLSVSFWVNKTVRCPLVWFSVSLSAFLVVRFYHGGYLLEAAYGLSIAMGMLLYVTINEIKLAIKKNDVIKEKTRAMIIFTVIVATVSGLVLMKTEQMHFLEKIKAVQVLINNNRNFNEMMDYMAAELPSGAIVYELPQVPKEKRRFLSLRERADTIKVMRCFDKQAMIKVLGRYDVIFEESRKISQETNEGNRYFVAENKLYKKIAEGIYSLKLIRSFERGDTEAAVFLLN
jgi:hypothetical protein